MIRKATLDDIDDIMKMTKACAKHMVSLGIFQWNDHYPNPSAFTKDVTRSELYVLLLDSRICGCIVISTLMDEEYKSIEWLTPHSNHFYIHRLAVHPNRQGNGYARDMMTFAEKLARENNLSSIRLDTFSQNKRNQKFYELRGYKKLGNIYFPHQSKHPFYCYELVI